MSVGDYGVLSVPRHPPVSPSHCRSSIADSLPALISSAADPKLDISKSNRWVCRDPDTVTDFSFRGCYVQIRRTYVAIAAALASGTLAYFVRRRVVAGQCKPSRRIWRDEIAQRDFTMTYTVNDYRKTSCLNTTGDGNGVISFLKGLRAGHYMRHSIW